MSAPMDNNNTDTNNNNNDGGNIEREVRGAEQLAIRTQVNKLLELGVIEESQASEWSQVHPVPKIE